MNVKGNFRLLNIILLESHFKRENKIEYTSQEDIIGDLALEISNNISDKVIEVTLQATIDQTIGERKIVDILVKMVAIFEREGEIPQETVENFCKISAPAIIFPFVRESIASISVKAGIPPIIIQPVNFVDLAKQKTVID